MGKKMLLAVPVLFSVLTSGCATPGSGPGAAVGGLTGALIDSRHPWRGGIIGAAAGAIAGATFYEISRQGAYESARSGRNVEYRTEDGRGRYEAEPLGRDERGCRKVREQLVENGKVIKKRIVLFCPDEEERGREIIRDRDDDRTWKRIDRDEN